MRRSGALPKVDQVLDLPAVRSLLASAPRWAVLSAVRGEIERLRAQLLARAEAGEGSTEVDAHAIAGQVAGLLRPSLERVLNATGVVLHTNLGRAPLAEPAIAQIADVCRGYSNLEYQLDQRRRGSRHDHVRGLLTDLTGAEDALVVNNCAAAVLLALAAHGAGRAAVVSRGELVEIGGSFRVPDVMRASGVRLIEVGTTNRTHLADYERALCEEGDAVALLLKVHRSNFAQVGFTAEVSAGELAELAHRAGRLAMVDLGSGALVNLRALGIEAREEPSVARVVATGVDLITFSADKLLGGPQAGILVGTRAALDACRTHPLLRAVRPSKLTVAALEATLALYRDGRAAGDPNPGHAVSQRAQPEGARRAPAPPLRSRRAGHAVRSGAGALGGGRRRATRERALVLGAGCQPWRAVGR